MDTEDGNDDELVLTPPDGVEAQDGDSPADDSDGEESFEIELEGEEAQDEAPLVKKLREEIRERDKRLAALGKSAPASIEVGPEPTMESCDYDEDAFKAQWRDWNARKVEADNLAAEQARAQQAREMEDQKRLANYRAMAAALPVKDYEIAEQTVVSRLPEMSRAALLAYTDNPAKVVYALHRYPAMLERIADEPDPIKQIIMARELEGKLKVTTRKKPPAPEADTIQRGSAPMSQKTDQEEERLYKLAEKSGDWTEWTRYRRSKRRAA